MSKHVQMLLVELELQLKQLQLWSEVAPDPAALASTMPFCVDTLPLHSWLQFIFIPRMHILLNAKAELPGSIHMLPIAEEAFKHLGEQAGGLLEVIDAIDQAVRAGL